MSRKIVISMGLLFNLNAMKTIVGFMRLKGEKELTPQGIGAFFQKYAVQFEPLRQQFNLGAINEVEFREQFCKVLEIHPIESSTFRKIWNAMIEIPADFSASWQSLSQLADPIIKTSNLMNQLH